MRYNSRYEVEAIGRTGVCSEWGDGGSLRCRMLSSFWLYCEPNDTAFTPHARQDGFWESWVTLWFSQNVQAGDVFLDVGANVGYYAGWAATHNCKEVVAFEPNPNLCNMLRATVRMNGWTNVFVEELALSNVVGDSTLYVPDGHSGAASMSDEGGNPVPIYTDLLDDTYLYNGGVNVFMKIDAEGAEPLIWAGMQENWATGNFTVALEWLRDRFDAEAFATELFDKAKVSIITPGGTDRPVSKEELLDLSELEMIVLRRK